MPAGKVGNAGGTGPMSTSRPVKTPTTPGIERAASTSTLESLACAYVDRTNVSLALDPTISTMMKDLFMDDKMKGHAAGIFFFGYVLLQIPGGYLGDLMGPRRVLTRIVLWWSFFTAATGWVWSWTSLLVTRFLFGAGEAGCFLNITKAFTTWLPEEERVRAQGIVWLSARWGGAFTPPLVVLAFRYMNWRWAFVTFGSIGMVWCFFFYRWFRDRPADHPSDRRRSRSKGHSRSGVAWVLLRLRSRRRSRCSPGRWSR